MDPGSRAPESDFRYVPMAGAPRKVWQATLEDGACSHYWWAVEWDLPHMSQHAGRRQHRWEHLLERAGWDISDDYFTSSSLSLHRKRENKPLNFYEQSIRTDSLIFLLAVSCNNQMGNRTSCHLQLQSMIDGGFLSDLPNDKRPILQGEILIGTANCSAACPLFDGRIDTQVIQALSMQGNRLMQKLWLKLKCYTNLNLCLLIDALLISCEVGLPVMICQSVAKMVSTALHHTWQLLSNDPLFSQVVPRRAKKKNARYDPDLKHAISDALRAGPTGLQLLDRMAGAFRGTSLLQNKRGARASDFDEEDVCRYLNKLQQIANQPACPSIAIAIDGSRIAGKKMLCGPIMFCNSGSLLCGWMLPQVMRDFRPSLDGTLSRGDIEQCLIGLRGWLSSLTQHEMTSEDDSNQFPLPPGSRASSSLPRVASLDLGYALESALQSVGLSLSNFTRRSQPLKHTFTCDCVATRLRTQKSSAQAGPLGIRASIDYFDGPGPELREY